MRALRILGAVILVAGVIGMVLWMAWIFEYSVGRGGFFSSLSGPIFYVVALGVLWGLLLAIVGFFLFSRSER